MRIETFKSEVLPMLAKYPCLAVALLAIPLPADAQTVVDTGEDRYAEDGPWIAVPADYDEGPLTAADIIAMADLDGDPLVITEEERRMIAVLSQVLLPSMP